MAKRFAIAGLSLLSAMLVKDVQAQTAKDGDRGTITTAVPFLRISPDSRGGGMGDAGIAISPDANSQFYNVGKIAMSDKQFGVSLTYTPWLKELVNDVWLGYLSGYYKFGQDNNQAISTSLRYFNLGNLEYYDENAIHIGSGKPREWAFDLGYSRKFSENFSAGVALRYINSNIAAGAAATNNVPYKAGNAFAADIGVFYTKTTMSSEERGGTFNVGAVLSNVGSKISYSDNVSDFIPINLGVGVAYTYQVDKYNKITGTVDFNKALTPVPIYRDSIGWDPQRDKGVISGMLNSFTQAPPGYGTNISVGGEYWYQDQFAVRAGYFWEHPENGNRQYFTVGLGVKYSVFGLNFSYLVASGSGIARNPLANTLRFSLLFDFDKEELAKLGGNKNKKRTNSRPVAAPANQVQFNPQ